MEHLRRSAAAGSSAAAFDDVFGGPPRHSGPFAARMSDYSEIFGGLASSCSIPVLDLPPPLAAAAYDAPRSSGLDYFEIFGGGEDVAPTYEELVAEQERAEAAGGRPEIVSSNGRAPKETELDQRTIDLSEFSPDGTNRNHGACFEKDQVSSNDNHLKDCSKQLNVPYDKPSQESIEDAINETAHMTHLHVVTGFTSDIHVSNPSQNIISDDPPNMAIGDLSLNASLNGRLSDQKQGRTFSSSSSAASSKSSGNGSKTDQRQFTTKRPTSVDGPANLKHHSRSSSNHSASSGDMYYPDFTYLTVSDISLRTQPLQVPPPSRPPPKLASNQEIIKMKIYANSKTDLDEVCLAKPIPSHKKLSDWDAPKRLAPRAPARDSSFFFDVEVDASSAAAASAAAMKEAMEQAEARLKSAKESMERKRDNFQSRKKMGHNEGSKREDQKEVKAAHEVKIFSEVVNQKAFRKEERKKNEFALEERQKAGGAAKLSPNHEEKERHIISDEHDQQMMQPDGYTSPQTSYKLNDRTGEWKTDKQFYELVHNEKKFKVAKGLSDEKYADKIPKETTKVDKERENERKVTDWPCDFERTENLWVVHETHEREENANKSKVGNKVFLKDEKKLPDTIPEIFEQEENLNQLEEVYDFHQSPEVESKLGESQEAQVTEEEVKIPSIGEDAPACRKTGVKPKHCIDTCNFEVAYLNKEKERKLKAAKEICECEECVELSKNHVTCQPHDNEKKLERTMKTGMQVENDEIKIPYASCMWEAGEKVDATPELSHCESSEKTRDETTPECYQEENGKTLKGTSLVSEQNESKKLNRTGEASVLVEHGMKIKVAEEANKMEESLEELKADEGGIRSREDEKIEVVEGVDYDESKTRGAQIELQQYEKELLTGQVPCELEDSEVLTVAVRGHEKKENENIREVQLDMDVKEKYNIFNVAQEVFRRVLNKDVEDFREAKLLEKKGKMLSSSKKTTESSLSVVTEQISPDVRKLEEREKKRHIERELEKERRMEEEREREREREKDRVAVERATREAHERAYAEARERAERIAVERVTAEARQRALTEAREKAEKASAEALEKSAAEKASREARLRVERAAVERATEEARERAVERALADKAAADARGRAEKLNAASSRDKMRRDNETEDHSRVSEKGYSGTRNTQDLTRDTQYKNVGSSSSGQRNVDSYNHGEGEGESALRCKARLERNQRTVERAAKALAEKNTRDILVQREQAERNRLAETLVADVRRWSTGKEGNLRALLSTLQYILGPESGWQPIPLTDVITAAAVKKAYRKATLCVHPDKLQQRGASIQQKYICEKVFDLLKDAWNRFNSEER